MPAIKEKKVAVVDPSILEFELYGGKIKGKFYGPTPDKPNRHMYYINGERKTGCTTFLGIQDKSGPLLIWAKDLIEELLIEKATRGKLTLEDISAIVSQPEKLKREASDIGSKIHDWCEKYIRHKLKEKGAELPDFPEESGVQVGVNAFLDWEKEHKVKFLSTERVVYSRKYDFIGKMDIEAIVDKKRVLVDLKSSNGLYNGVRMQTAAYAMADTEENGKKYEGRWAIRLAKETEEEYIARFKKKQAKDIRNGREPREIPPYQVFEAKDLDLEAGWLERDFKAFLFAVGLFRWNEKTDPWKVGSNW